MKRPDKRWTIALTLGGILASGLRCASHDGGDRVSRGASGGTDRGDPPAGESARAAKGEDGGGPGVPGGSGAGGGNGSGRGGGVSEEIHAFRRARMVETQIRARGVKDTEVLEAMRKVPRHLFVPEGSRDAAYDDGPLSIGESQTISQPYIVALMTELIRPKSSDRILEIGTGSGYQAAVLAEIVEEVDTIEIVEPLGRHADALLTDLGYKNIRTRIGDGYRGWPERAPYDGVLVTAAPERIPEALKEQLAVGGRLVIPLGSVAQDLVCVTRTATGFTEERITPVRFVPMTGEAQRDR